MAFDIDTLVCRIFLRNIDLTVQFVTVLFNNGNIAVRHVGADMQAHVLRKLATGKIINHVIKSAQ